MKRGQRLDAPPARGLGPRERAPRVAGSPSGAAGATRSRRCGWCRRTSRELLALPLAWTPRDGRAPARHGDQGQADDKDDLEKQKGKLAGKILMLGEPREVKPRRRRSPSATTRSPSPISPATRSPACAPTCAPASPSTARSSPGAASSSGLNKFIVEEKVAAVIEAGAHDGGTFRVQGVQDGQRKDAPAAVPDARDGDRALGADRAAARPQGARRAGDQSQDEAHG